MNYMNTIRTAPVRGRGMHNSNRFKYTLEFDKRDYCAQVVCSNGKNYVVTYRYLRPFLADISQITKVVAIYDRSTDIQIY